MEDKIIKMYLEGMSLTKIAKTLGVDRTCTVRRVLLESGFEIINKQNLLRVREDLFESIETEEDAYWLGFIYADGSISEGGSLEISLSQKDVNHLYKFKDFTKCTNSVKENQKTNYKDYKRCRIQFGVKRFQKRFTNLGIVPRKSCILTYPDFLHENLHKHFIRGYVDGDGSFNIYKYNTRKDYRFSIVGTLDMLLSIQKHLGISIKCKRKGSCAYQMHTGGRKRVINILNYLYEDSNIYLDRKYEIYTKLCRSSKKFEESLSRN